MMEMSDSGEEDVVEVKAANSLLPNLTISVHKDDEDNEGPTVEFQEDEEPATKSDEVLDESTVIKVEPKSFPHTKIYENKALKEMGLTGEEAKLRKMNRAKRFCSPLLREENANQEPEIELKNVDSLIEKVEEHNKAAQEDDLIRLEAINISGLDDMSTEDIFSFLADFFPSHIEWINDTSCNVVWKDERSAAIAIVSLTKPKNPIKKEVEVKGQETKPASKYLEKDDSLDLLESDDEMEVEEGVNSTAEGGNSATEGSKTETEDKNGDLHEDFSNEPKRCKKYFHKNGRKVLLKLRFAVVKDRKVLGGAKKSRYYQKYGNPRYGNAKGILSRSFMKRFHGRVAREEFESYRPSKGQDDAHGGQKQDNKNSENSTVRKRMYSDLEKVKSKKQKVENSSRTSSGSESDYESDVEEENAQEKEDLDLIHSSAKDLADARPAQYSDDNEEDLDTMMADRVTKKDEASKQIQKVARQSGNLNITVKSGNVWSRLGKKKETSDLKFTIDNRERGQRNVMDRLPASLKSRLGTKKRY